MFTIAQDPLTKDSQRVTDEGRAKTQALTLPIQAHVSADEGFQFQIVGEAQPNANTVTVLHLKNVHADRVLLIDYIRANLIGTGGTAFPATAHYWTHEWGETYSSGGTAEVAVNTNPGSSHVGTDVVTGYDNNPTLGGTSSIVDKEPIESNGKTIVWRKDGGIVIPPNKTFCVKCTTDHTSATAVVRISFTAVLLSHLE
jgi:hypothetical protein